LAFVFAWQANFDLPVDFKTPASPSPTLRLHLAYPLFNLNLAPRSRFRSVQKPKTGLSFEFKGFATGLFSQSFFVFSSDFYCYAQLTHCDLTTAT